MKLFICEKPSQGRDIAKVLGANERNEGYLSGNGVIVTWALGHLLAFAPPERYCADLKPWRLGVLPVVPDQWQIEPNPKTKKQLNVVRELIKQTNHVVVATDADREGEAIARELLDYCNYQGTIERLWLSALDEASIKKALTNLKTGESTYPLYQAALGRSRADWLIGMNMTMGVTSSFSRGEGVLSVGRVQTPTLQLVVNRDLAIENFKVSDYYVVQATFSNQSSESFITTWNVPEDEQDEAGHCLKREAADRVCADITNQQGTVTAFSEKQKQTPAPSCLSLSSLQKLASSQLGLGAKETLDTAQSLYETHKAASYPRTDCGYLPLSQFKEAPAILATLKETHSELSEVIDQCNTSYQSPVWDDKKITAHHGIIPTNNRSVDLTKMNDKERKLFDLICRYYVAQFLGTYDYAQRKVTVTCVDHTFSATDNTPLKQGWKVSLAKVEPESKDEKSTGNAIPKLSQDETVNCSDQQVLAKQTKPPARFTEGTLIAAMKNVAKEVDDKQLKKILKDTAGIGTEATRANIIELLLKREFLQKDKKTLISTKRGRELLTKLPDCVKHPATTAEWEQTLDDVAEGKAKLEDFLAGQKKTLNTMIDALKAMVKAQPIEEGAAHYCPDCKQPMQRRKGKKGFFWGCSGYPNCTTTMPDVDGKPVPRKPVELSDHDCPLCSSHKLVKRQGKKSAFWGCAGYPKCKGMYWDKNGEPDLTTPQKKKGN